MTGSKTTILTSVNVCVECGTLQAPGFRGGTPISKPQDEAHVKNKIELFAGEDSDFDVSPNDLPDHITSDYLVMLSANPCPNCGNHFFTKTNLRTPDSLREINSEGDLLPFNEL